jgi:two-component system sensor histidine kinase RegB
LQKLPPANSAPLVIDPVEGRLRLNTIVRLRWMAVLGQLIAIGIVTFIFGFSVPIGACLTVIALSAWLNVFLGIRYPPRHRLSVGFATALLIYDIVQLAALLYLTGGINNPFTMLIVAPVTVSAATLPPRTTIVLGFIALASTALLVVEHEPLPWYEGTAFELPRMYKFGIFAAVCASTTFMALYAWRLTKESRQMSAALAATDLVLAREQKLHALDGLAAAAAHELGTPLSTIAVVTKELEHHVGADDPLRDDIQLLNAQALRCREILLKLTRRPSEQDPLHARVSVRAMLEEAAAPYRSGKTDITIVAGPADAETGAVSPEAVAERRPGVIYGLGNIIENATEFALNEVTIRALWNAAEVVVTITDDGPGFPPDVMDNVGEPYVTTRPAEDIAGMSKADFGTSGLGLGFFIAKTLLERSGASVSLENRMGPATGAIVRITWPRDIFEGQEHIALTKLNFGAGFLPDKLG